MTSVLDIITDALEDAGVIASGETPSAADTQKAFRLLNRMLEADSTENLMIFNNVSEVFDLVSGQLTYTIGPGGDFDTTRPISINSVYMRDVNNNDLPVKMLDYAAYAAIISKTIDSTIATGVYYNASFPLSELTFLPVVEASTYRAVVWSWKQLTSFTSVSDQVILPPGYEDYMEFGLARKLIPAFNTPVNPAIDKLAIEAKAKLKRINVDVPVMQTPVGLIGQAPLITFPISPSILTGY